MAKISSERFRRLWIIEITAILIAVMLHLLLAKGAVFMLIPHKQSEKPEFIFLGSILPMALSDKNGSSDETFETTGIKNVFFQKGDRFFNSPENGFDDRQVNRNTTTHTDKSFLKTTFLSSESDSEVPMDTIVESLGRAPLKYEPLDFNRSP